MANMEWPKTDYSQRHRVQHPHHQWNVSNLWHRQNVPKTQPCHQQRTQRNSVRPPDLLRLNSVGESVEEFPNSGTKRRQFCARQPRNFSPAKHHQQSNSDFVGKFWNKVREPMRTRQNLVSSQHSPQHNVDLDQLADKFSGNFEIDPQKFQPSMDHNQEVGRRPVPVVTFDGGPYIKCESKGNTTASTRMFPAYYRFLSFAHFHPYNNNIVRNRMMTAPPFQQQRTGSWVEIAQHRTPQKSPCHDSHHKVNGAPLFTHTVKRSYDQHKMFNPNKSVVKDRMMQNQSTVSHQHGQQHRRSEIKPTPPADIKNCKQKQATQHAKSNVAAVENESSLPVPSAIPSKASEVVKTTPCEFQSQSRLTDAINSANTSQDKSTNQLDSLEKHSECIETDCFCSSAETAKLFELKLETCNTNESDVCIEESESTSTNTLNAAEHEDGIANKKQMHSTLAYLLGDYMNDTQTCSNDSDFSDVDDEDLDDTSRELLDSFMPPNNPVYAWKCLGNSDDTPDSDHLTPEAESNSGVTLTLNDSGTVLEQTSDEATTHSQSDVEDSDSELSDESSDSGCDQQEIPDSQNPSSNLYDPMGGQHLESSSPLKMSKGTAVEPSEATFAQQNNSNKAAVLKLCSTSVSQIHPSLSFILGLDSPDGSDTEDSIDSEDSDYDQLWNSFESPSDPYNPINGCKFQSPSLANQSAKSHDDSAETLSKTDESAKSSSDSSRKSSSTGCLKKVAENCKERVKKVSFCSKDPIVICPEVGVWEQEYMEARRGHWEQYARDRCRFQRRIRQAEFIISPFLRPQHRAKIVVKLDL